MEINIGYNKGTKINDACLAILAKKSNRFFYGDYAKIMYTLMTDHAVSEELHRKIFNFCQDHGLWFAYDLEEWGYVTFRFENDKEEKYRCDIDLKTTILNPTDDVFREIILKLHRHYSFDLVIGSGKVKGHKARAKKITYTRDRARDEREYRRPRERFHSEDYVLETRNDAWDVRDQLLDMLDEYGIITIEDFKDLIGVSPKYTDKNWGWTNLRSASIKVARGGFVVSLPAPVSVV